MNSFEGPLPPPEVLDGYRRIDPSFPERIMRMAETSQDRRHAIEKGILDGVDADCKRRFWIALGGLALMGAIALVAFIVAGILAYSGAPVSASVASAIVGITPALLASGVKAWEIYEGRREKREGKPGGEPRESRHH